MIRRVDLLMPVSSQYEALHHFTKKLYEAFVRAGLEARLLPQGSFADSFQRDKPDLTIGFNGGPRNANGELLCEVYQIPHLAILVDPPYHYPYLLKSRYMHISCDDPIGCVLLREMGMERTFFLPHAVEPELAEGSDTEKSIDILLPATFIDFEKERTLWPSLFSKEVCTAMENAAERCFSGELVSFIDAFRQEHKRPLDMLEMGKPLEKLELYIKGRDRALLASSITAGSLHIYGSGAGGASWNQYRSKLSPQAVILNPQPFESALSLMKRAKVVLNPNIKNTEGGHERLFSAPACGAAVVTSESSLTAQDFAACKGVVRYRHGELDTVNGAIETLLRDEPLRKAKAYEAQKIVLAKHTWDQRVQTILSALAHQS